MGNQPICTKAQPCRLSLFTLTERVGFSVLDLQLLLLIQGFRQKSLSLLLLVSFLFLAIPCDFLIFPDPILGQFLGQSLIITALPSGHRHRHSCRSFRRSCRSSRHRKAPECLEGAALDDELHCHSLSLQSLSRQEDDRIARAS